MLATAVDARFRRVFCTVMMWLGAPLQSGAAEPPPTLKPVSVVTLPPSDSGAIALAPDGQTVYHVEEVRHVNIWALAAFRWPEWSAGLACVGGVVVGITLWRRARRRRGWEPGEPYCRKCGYRLSGITVQQCPECGRDITTSLSRVIARRVWSKKRKVLVHVSTLVIVCVAACFPTRFALVRESLGRHPTAGRFHWSSRALFELARSHDLKWVRRHAEEVSVIVRRDVRTGAKVGEFEGHFDLRVGYPLKLSPDGLTLWMRDRTGLRSWDVRTGKAGKTLEWPGGNGEGFDYFAIGTEAAMAWSSRVGTTPNVVAAWDFATGQLEPIPADLQLENTLIAPLPDGVRVLTEPREGSERLLIVDRRSGQPAPPGVIQTPLDLDSPMLTVSPEISRDGRRIFPANSHGVRWPSKGRLVRGWNLETGKPLRPVGPFFGKNLITVGTVPMQNGRRIVTWKQYAHTAQGTTSLQIDDVDRERTVAILDMSPHVPADFQGIMLSSDERTVIVLHKLLARTRGVAKSFSAFDLSALPPLD